MKVCLNSEVWRREQIIIWAVSYTFPGLYWCFYIIFWLSPSPVKAAFYFQTSLRRKTSLKTYKKCYHLTYLGNWIVAFIKILLSIFSWIPVRWDLCQRSWKGLNSSLKLRICAFVGWKMNATKTSSKSRPLKDKSCHLLQGHSCLQLAVSARGTLRAPAAGNVSVTKSTSLFRDWKPAERADSSWWSENRKKGFLSSHIKIL